MTKVLTRDEKDYINKKLIERQNYYVNAEKLKETINTLIKEYLPDPVRKALEDFEEYTKQSLMSKVILSAYVRSDNFTYDVQFSNSLAFVKINIQYPKKVGMTINKIIDAYLKYHWNDNNCFKNSEEYYILFSTWNVPSNERLAKINELIDLIFNENQEIQDLIKLLK